MSAQGDWSPRDVPPPADIEQQPAQSAPAQPFWGYTDLLLFLGLTLFSVLLVVVGVAAALVLIPALNRQRELAALPAQVVLYVLIYLALWFIFRVKYGRPMWRSLGWLRSKIPLWASLLGGVGLSVFVGVVGAALRTPQIPSPFDKFMQGPFWIAVFGLFAVLLGPVTEEVIFRGFIQPLLSRSLGITAGILLTALVFGALHLPEYSDVWQYMVLITVVGFCLGWVRAIGQSLIPAAVMHAGFNAVFFFTELFQKHLHL